DGGVLIGLGGGATLFTNKDVDLTSSRLAGSDEESKTAAPAANAPATPAAQPGASPDETKPATREPATPNPRPSAKQPARPGEKKPEETAAPKKKPTTPVAVPGTAFRARVNHDHFLTYGYSADSVVVMIQGDAFFRASKDGANVLTFPTEGPLTVAGFTW